jgi:hypothetical protein
MFPSCFRCKTPELRIQPEERIISLHRTSSSSRAVGNLESVLLDQKSLVCWNTFNDSKVLKATQKEKKGTNK